MPVANPRITVFTPEAGGFYMGEVCKGIDEVCRARGAQPIIIQTAISWEASAFEPLPIEGFIGLARAFRSGSIVVTSVQEESDLALLRQIEEPVVAVAGPALREGGTAVLVDNAGGARQAVRHLIEHGHKRIGFVGAFFQFDVRERYEGYLAVLKEAGIDPDPDLAFAIHDDLEWGGREAANAILEAGVPLTAVFASTDTHAVSLMKRLREAGVRIPEEVAVIGFDDFELAHNAVPALTSVRQRPASLGSLAARLVLAQVDGLPAVPGPQLLPTTLSRRHSCGCFADDQHLFDECVDWTSPDWRERLVAILTRELLMPAGRDEGTSGQPAWPSAWMIVEALNGAIEGWPISNVSGLDAAWWEAGTLTRNPEVLLRLVDLLEFVGLCRQGESGVGAITLRSRLRDFLAQCRLQVLRYAAITDPSHHPNIPKATRRVVRSFLEDGDSGRPSLEWLRNLEAVSGCLGLWEGGAHEPRRLRIAALYGAGATMGGSLVDPESFPPVAWLNAARIGEARGTVMVLPIVSPRKDWGFLATVLPDDLRYYDGYWGLQYGAALLALALDTTGRR